MVKQNCGVSAGVLEAVVIVALGGFGGLEGVEDEDDSDHSSSATLEYVLGCTVAAES